MACDQGCDCALLGESALFEGLSAAEVRRLAEVAEMCTFGDRDAVVAEGAFGDALFVLHDGEVDVTTHDPAGSEVLLTTVGSRGAFFGEVALVDPGPRSATIRARGQARLLQFTVDGLEAFFGEFPDAQALVLRNIARALARRLRESNTRFAAASAS